MAFDLVHYFAEQIKIQKPQLLNQYPAEQRQAHLFEINALSLGKIISLWRTDSNHIYQEIQSQDQLYIQEIARHLTTSAKNESELKQTEFEHCSSEILTFQFQELKQLDDTGHYGQNGMRELLLGQIEHLSGQAKDWVWSVNELNELIGSQPIVEESVSFDETMKEFNQMVHTQQNPVAVEIEHDQPEVIERHPTWAKVAEPIVALVVLWVLWNALQTYVFA
ncbi:hypothetical protein EC844_12158 [Acinetobacter calcoaceticus]|uniref:Uncharacterized protein n=1 Tax=Acinetobacter calcoaceticus TaxID=471 RepID=A0A4R1XUG6_ACICA|nr:hypothetical protein EC844_12158 [Acinetobacter calcoaceticus]